MPSTRRRRNGAVAAVALTLAVLGLAGCKQDNTPQQYDSTTHDNFIQGCTGQDLGVQGASQDTCQCAYDWFTVNVPINSKTPASVDGYSGPNFTDLNAQLVKDPTDFPDSVTSALRQACPEWGTASPSTEGTQPGPLVPGTSVPPPTLTPQ